MKHTTLGEYMVWIRDNGGSCQNGMRADPEIGMVPVIKLIAHNGRHVIHPDSDQDEILSPLLIENYDRRLQVISPFRSVKRS